MMSEKQMIRWGRGLMMIIVSALLIAAVAHLVSAEQIENILVLRVPLLAGFFLFVLPIIALYLLPSVLENLFVLENSLRLAVVIIQASVTGLGIVFVWSVIDLNSGCRFLEQTCSDSPPALNVKAIMPYLMGILLALPVAYTSWAMADIKKAQKLLGIALGGVSVFAIYFTIYRLRQSDSSALLDTTSQFLVLLLNLVLPESQQAGFINPDTGDLSDGHMLALSFMLVTFAIYAFCYFFYRPSPVSGKLQAPALYYLLVLIVAFTFVFGLLTFFLDYYRIPALLVALFVSWAVFKLFDTDHFFKLENTSQSRSATVRQALKQRLALNNDGTLVVVCASGGGIQAAGWAAMVLMQLQRLLGQSFANAIGLISSVSGGSVGAMHYLDCMNAFAEPDKKQLFQIFQNATKNSLDATGWGLAYPDLWRIMGASFLPSKLNDRGTVLETDWKTVMYDANATFDHWYSKMSDGKLPIAVFNATQVEYGQRLLLSPISFSATSNHNKTDFNALYQHHTIDVTTAARLSATFAYVSPIAKDNLDVQPCHVADGGYFDNYGVFTANQWLTDEVLPDKEELGIKRIIYLEIRAFSAQPKQQATQMKSASQTGSGWMMALLGPLLTLANVRNATQNARNEYDVDIMTRCQSKNIDFQRFVFEFPSRIPYSKDKTTGMVKKMVDKLATEDYTPPLSWKLSAWQKKAIWKGWYQIKTNDKAASHQDLQNLLKVWNNQE